MEGKRYIISEAVEKTGIEPHVLRYWEEELGLEIPRNEMGHRYYTDSQLQMFRQIKDLKNSGFQLKAIKTVLESGPDSVQRDDGESRPQTHEQAQFNEAGQKQVQQDAAATMSVTDGQQELAMKRSEDKLAQFEQIIGDIVTRSLIANNGRLGEDISFMVTNQVSNKVIKEMDYMFRVREEAEDERYKKLDETIRGIQRSGKEAAAYREKQEKKIKKSVFKKRAAKR